MNYSKNFSFNGLTSFFRFIHVSVVSNVNIETMRMTTESGRRKNSWLIHSLVTHSNTSVLTNHLVAWTNLVVGFCFIIIFLSVIKFGSNQVYDIVSVYFGCSKSMLRLKIHVFHRNLCKRLIKVYSKFSV